MCIYPKVHNHNILDCDPRCTLHCKVHLWLNIDIFGFYFFKLGRLKCKFQSFISFLWGLKNAFESIIQQNLIQPNKIITLISIEIHYSMFEPLHFEQKKLHNIPIYYYYYYYLRWLKTSKDHCLQSREEINTCQWPLIIIISR